jgi:hypothetical protein
MSLSVIESAAANLLRRAGDMVLYEEVFAFRDAYFQAFESGDKEATRQVIDLHDGDGSFDALPSGVRDYINATTATNILDWRSAMDFDASSPAYSGIAIPTLVIRGELRASLRCEERRNPEQRISCDRPGGQVTPW